MTETMVHSGPLACKEWGAVVRALLAGEQILDIRKGGIREPGRRFNIASDRFFLFPTIEHQEPALLKPAYRSWVDPRDARRDETIVIGGWAEVAHHVTISDEEHLAALDSKHIWASAYAATRLHWKRQAPLWILVLRVHRLLDPIVIPDRAGYHGCTSWVALDDFPEDPYELPSEPALTDTAFTGRVANLPSWLQP